MEYRPGQIRDLGPAAEGDVPEIEVTPQPEKKESSSAETASAESNNQKSDDAGSRTDQHGKKMRASRKTLKSQMRGQ